MKLALLSALVFCGFTASAQVLPVDSASGKVVYRGLVQVPGADAGQLFAKAKRYAQVATQSPLIEPSTLVVSGPTEKPVGGRVLVFEVYIKAEAGAYRYELSDFQNKTLPVQYNSGVGTRSTAPGGQAPLERVLANPDGYRKGKPTAALAAYKRAVAAVAEQAVADLQHGMK